MQKSTCQMVFRKMHQFEGNEKEEEHTYMIYNICHMITLLYVYSPQ